MASDKYEEALHITNDDLNQVRLTDGISEHDYVTGRVWGVPHNDLMEAHEWDDGSSDKHLYNYALARSNGASHSDSKEAFNHGIKDLSKYAKLLHSGVSHKDALSMQPEQIDEHLATVDAKDAGNRYKNKFLSPLGNVGDTKFSVEPTAEEYEESRSKDIDPDSFDRATHKRVRNLGASHADILDSHSSGIPLEDYETARANNQDSHVQAIDEALRYRDHYTTAINSNAAYLNTPEGAKRRGFTYLTPTVHDELVKDLFGHHMALKNNPNYDDPETVSSYNNKPEGVPERRRSNEWIMNECSKLTPALKPHVGKTGIYDDNMILPVDKYSKNVKTLLNHYRINQLNCNNVQDYAVNNRKINALVNIGSSQFIPSGYTHDKYEEE